MSFFKVHLSFLHVGHTHEDIDASFSQLSMKLRKADAETMPQLLSLLNGANQLRGLFDIKAWLEPCLNNIKKHSKPLHFKFSKDVTQKTVMQYRANSNRPWNFTDEAILHSIPSGQPRLLLPPNFHKIEISAIRKNIEKQQYNFSGDGQYNWWLQYLDYLQLVKNNKDTMIDYAKRGAEWLIPILMNKQKPSENSNADIDGHLFEMLDRELDDHEVSKNCRLKLKKKSISNFLQLLK